MNNDIRSLPNGDFEVVYKKEESFLDLNNYYNCPKCIKPDFPYQMACVCPPDRIDVSIVASQKGIHYLNYKNQFVYHKESKEIYYVKSDRNFDPGDSAVPNCYCITLKNYLYGNKINTVEYDEMISKEKLELINLSEFDKELLLNKQDHIKHAISSTFDYMRKRVIQKEYPK